MHCQILFVVADWISLFFCTLIHSFISGVDSDILKWIYFINRDFWVLRQDPAMTLWEIRLKEKGLSLIVSCGIEGCWFEGLQYLQWQSSCQRVRYGMGCFVNLKCNKWRLELNDQYFREKWKKNFVSWLQFYWGWFSGVQMKICHHWLRWWLGTKLVMIHHLNQWWSSSLAQYICITSGPFY